MTAHAIQLSRDLRGAGLNQEQAEIIAQGIAEAVEEGAATKAGIARLETSIAKLEEKITNSEMRLTIRFIGGVVLLIFAILLKDIIL